MIVVVGVLSVMIVVALFPFVDFVLVAPDMLVLVLVLVLQVVCCATDSDACSCVA
jgi:hypothetical protein